jgi:uncharacterized membrane protein YsdA (DUF1294 family)/cold shock CspA family protein
MRRSGTIIKWDDEKGFGFIACSDHAPDVFLHCRALADRIRRPKVGDWVEFELDYDTQRRPRAERAVLRQGLSVPASQSRAAAARRGSASSRRARADRSAMGPAELLCCIFVPLIVLSAVALAARSGFIPQWIAVLYVGMSAVTAIAYGIDKFRATRGHWRIAEGTLQLFAMAGGWPGAFAAQRFFRHKISKLPFQVTYWLIVTAHVAFWSWFTASQSGWLSR